VNPAEQAMRDQEVLRATRELAAYFKGGRTEREARAALKIIKAFVRERERLKPENRPPLPGTKPAAKPVAALPKKKRATKPKRSSKRAASHESQPATTPPDPSTAQ
jgi:hypothetical protein